MWRFPGRAVEEADRGLPLEARAAARLRPGGHRGSHQPRNELPSRDPRSGRRRTPESLLQPEARFGRRGLEPVALLWRPGDRGLLRAGPTIARRKTLLDESAEQLGAYLHNAHRLELRKPLDEARRAMLEGGKPVHPFHWEIEFPEVFDRRESGVRCIRGQSAVLAGKNLNRNSGISYFDWLATIHERVARQRRSCRPLLPSASSRLLRTRELRPDRDEHDRPGRHAQSGLALDLQKWRHDLSRQPAGRNGQDKLPWS